MTSLLKIKRMLSPQARPSRPGPIPAEDLDPYCPKQSPFRNRRVPGSTMSLGARPSTRPAHLNDSYPYTSRTEKRLTPNRSPRTSSYFRRVPVFDGFLCRGRPRGFHASFARYIPLFYHRQVLHVEPTSLGCHTADSAAAFTSVRNRTTTLKRTGSSFGVRVLDPGGTTPLSTRGVPSGPPRVAGLGPKIRGRQSLSGPDGAALVRSSKTRSLMTPRP